MHNIQSKKRANASLLYGNRSGLIFSPSSERPQCSVKRGDCLSKASLQKQLSIGERKNFGNASGLQIDQNRNSQRIISILLSHHTLKLKINKTHYEAVHAPCL